MLKNQIFQARNLMYSFTGFDNVYVYPTKSNSSGSTAPGNPIADPVQQHHQPTIMIPVLPPPPAPFSGGGGSDYDEFPRRDERFPQWSNQETREFIEIRAQLEWDFATSKRNKNLWEMVAGMLRDKGFRRTADQCKCKWKNLVNKYKGTEVDYKEGDRRCPFFDELHAVFAARDSMLLQAQLDSEMGSMKGKKRLKNAYEDQSFEESDGDETEIDHVEVARTATKGKAPAEKRLKTEKRAEQQSKASVSSKDGILSTLQEILRNFFQLQQMIDTEWRDSMVRRAQEKETFEQEWRQTMEKLERERLEMERAWRAKEEERRIREEGRAEQRDANLNTLLNKLIQDEER